MAGSSDGLVGSDVPNTCQLPSSGAPAQYWIGDASCSGQLSVSQCTGVRCCVGCTGTANLSCDATGENFGFSGCLGERSVHGAVTIPLSLVPLFYSHEIVSQAR